MATSAPFENSGLVNTSLMPPPPDGGTPPDAGTPPVADGTQRIRSSKSQWVCHSLPVQIGDEPEKDVHVYYSKHGGGAPLFDLVRVAMVLCCVEKGTARTAVCVFFKTHADVEKVCAPSCIPIAFRQHPSLISANPSLILC